MAAAKAWFILGGATREDRLQPYLNEELGALYGASWNFTDPDSRTEIDARTADLVVVGATLGLRPARTKGAKDWEAPYLIHPSPGEPPSETAVARSMFAAAGLSADQAGKPYTLLSAATHGRFNHSGVSDSIPTGRTVNGLRTRAQHTSQRTTAKVTVLAAIATRTHLRARARYANVSEACVQDRVGNALAEWCGDRRSLGARVTCRGQKCFALGKTLHSSNTDGAAYTSHGRHREHDS